jgi:hypothetical protein
LRAIGVICDYIDSDYIDSGDYIDRSFKLQ